MTSRYAYEPLAYALHAGVASLFERLEPRGDPGKALRHARKTARGGLYLCAIVCARTRLNAPQR